MALGELQEKEGCVQNVGWALGLGPGLDESLGSWCLGFFTCETGEAPLPSQGDLGLLLDNDTGSSGPKPSWDSGVKHLGQGPTRPSSDVAGRDHTCHRRNGLWRPSGDQGGLLPVLGRNRARMSRRSHLFLFSSQNLFIYFRGENEPLASFILQKSEVGTSVATRGPAEQAGPRWGGRVSGGVWMCWRSQFRFPGLPSCSAAGPPSGLFGDSGSSRSWESRIQGAALAALWAAALLSPV